MSVYELRLLPKKLAVARVREAANMIYLRVNAQ